MMPGELGGRPADRSAQRDEPETEGSRPERDMLAPGGTPDEPNRGAAEVRATEASGASPVEAMWARDGASHRLGIRLSGVGPGYALTRMVVREDMVNGHGICHGGYLFLLADSTFALACNSHGRAMVAAACEIHFVRPARVGEELVASALERVTTSGTSICDVDVQRAADNVTVAIFRGQARPAPALGAPPSGATAPPSSAPG